MPMEESPERQQRTRVREIVERGRDAIGKVNDVDVRVALFALANAIEEANHEPPSAMTLELTPGALDVLRQRIDAAGERTFVISFPEIELNLDDIWDEGEAPDEPTAKDVLRAMRATDPSSAINVVTDWNLVEEIYVRRSDESEDEAVVFDG